MSATSAYTSFGQSLHHAMRKDNDDTTVAPSEFTVPDTRSASIASFIAAAACSWIGAAIRVCRRRDGPLIDGHEPYRL
jgi:hypothetical protein